MRSGIRRWSSRASRWLISLLLLATLIYCVAETARLVVRGPAPPSATWGQRLSSTNASRPTLSQAQIKQWHLFGDHAPTGSESGASSGRIPTTQMAFVLLGVFYNQNGQRGWAIIQQQGGEAKLYRTGDALDDDTTLGDLYARYVILKRKGHKEKLPLLAWDATQGITAVAASTSKPDEKQVLSSREKTMKRLGVEPVNPGTASGYRVVDENGDLVKKLGFHKGDVVVSVNGYPLGTEDSDVLARQTVVDAGIGNIIVQRGDKQFMLEYQTGKSGVRGMDALIAESPKPEP